MDRALESNREFPIPFPSLRPHLVARMKKLGNVLLWRGSIGQCNLESEKPAEEGLSSIGKFSLLNGGANFSFFTGLC